jgi:hypothetical protein
MDKSELYKFRAEDFSNRFYSLVKTEWTIAFQTYAGYGVIALAFTHAITSGHGNILFLIAGIVATEILFLVHLYLRTRTHERLTEYRRVMIVYLKKLHRELDAPEEKVGQHLKHKDFYAYGAQMLLSGVACAFLCIYFEIIYIYPA